MIRMLDHTADVGFELKAPTLEALFEEARQALLMTLFEEPPKGGQQERLVRLSGPDRETLLVRWINELVVPAGAELRIREESEKALSLEARLLGVPLDHEGHGFQGEIKSATFHGLDVTLGNEGWQTRVILDV